MRRVVPFRFPTTGTGDKFTDVSTIRKLVLPLLIGVGILCSALLSACTDNAWQIGTDGTGYSVQCADGVWSNSGGRQGACSSHGGVGYSDESLENSDSTVETPENSLEPLPEPLPEPPPRVPPLPIPNGFFYGGDVFAVKWIDEPTCPHSGYGCTAAEVYALERCELGGFARANFLDTAGLIIDTGIDLVPGLYAGDRAEVTFTSFDERTEATAIVGVECSDIDP